MHTHARTWRYCPTPRLTQQLQQLTSIEVDGGKGLARGWEGAGQQWLGALLCVVLRLRELCDACTAVRTRIWRGCPTPRLAQPPCRAGGQGPCRCLRLSRSGSSHASRLILNQQDCKLDVDFLERYTSASECKPGAERPGRVPAHKRNFVVGVWV